MPEQPSLFQQPPVPSGSEAATGPAEPEMIESATTEVGGGEKPGDVILRIRNSLEACDVISPIANVLRETILAGAAPNVEVAIREIRSYIDGQ